MKIAILQDDFPPESIGGAGVVAYNLAQGLKEKGCEVIVITSTEKDYSVKIENGIKIYRLKTNNFGFFKHYFCLFNPWIVDKVKEILDKERPDVAHCHNLHTALSYHCLKLARKFSKKVFLTAHDTMMFTYGKMTTENYVRNFDYKVSVSNQIEQAGKQYNPFRNLIIRHYLKNVDKVFAVSQALKKALDANKIKNVEVIYNGINVDYFISASDEVERFKEQYGLEDKKIILFGGRVSKPKGAEQILKVLRVIKEEVDDVILIVAGGETHYLNYLKSFSQKLGVEEKVLFLGQLPHNKMPAIYDVSNVVVVPSLYLDPFPTVNLEAMARKKPVIGTCFGGTPEIVQDRVTGYIVNSFDIEEMAEKIVDLLQNPGRARQFGEAGYERVKNNFSLDKQVSEILRWYWEDFKN